MLSRWLALPLILLPLAEIAVFVWVGGWLGVGPVLALVLLSAIAGGMVLRAQGVAVLGRLRREMEAGGRPGVILAEGALVVLGALLLIFPGFLTDFAGLVLLVPPLRRLLIARFGLRAPAGAQTAGFGGTSAGVVDLDPQDWHATGGGETGSPWKQVR